MAIIVNKEEKRRNIALSCRELLLEQGINSLTISQIAKTAGVGKGTIYEYFENKEDIVFEIITTFISDHEKELLALVDTPITTREKLFHFLYFLFENEIAGKHLNVYQEFLAISLSSEPEAMLVFSEECRKKFTMILDLILEAGKASGEIEKTMPISSSSLTLFATGLVVDSRLESCDIKKEIDLFLDMILPSK
ncbi:TetR/AcrR family transcriptional regulator [Sulfurovum sp. XTW-4]|uniref:TetR/AcrR family transcriptional regulator n=1 Tax=Sulfurovum xiamenensis TaxID=3019066 RepID=A0ABT7QTF3_9BACT|nr:TetR/AcrR family transcriptional regulator [Sulfurovum xiamenensis]MDM5264360.1 TetR/AcrR family transcriptional regulator [Sulfurovum xiamenensis]